MINMTDLYGKEGKKVTKMEYEGYLDYTHSSVVMDLIGEEIEREERKYKVPDKVEEFLDNILEKETGNVCSVIGKLSEYKGCEVEWIFKNDKNLDIFVINYIERKNKKMK